MYKLVLEHQRYGGKYNRTFYVECNEISQACLEALQICMNEDETGYFFPVSECDSTREELTKGYCVVDYTSEDYCEAFACSPVELASVVTHD